MKITNNIKNSIKYDLLKKPIKLAKTHDFCLSRKSKLTVVMLHGIASSSKTYDHTIKYFRSTPALKNIRFITFDWLGNGKSYSSNHLCYDVDEEVSALQKSLEKAKIKTPLILIGHSMGTMLVAHYASLFPKTIKEIFLVSPPIYSAADLKNPIFIKGIDSFKTAVTAYDKKLLVKRPFNAQLENIVKNPTNYKAFSSLKVKTTMIYGSEDAYIAPFNVEKIAKSNKFVTAIKTNGRHGVSREKYAKIASMLEESLNETV